KDFLELYNSIICNSFENNDSISSLAKDLQKSQNPVIICGTDIVPVSVPEIAADIAVFLKILNRKPGLFYLMPGPNALGSGLLSNEDSDFETLVSEIENGKIRALITTENNLFSNIADHENLNRILEKLELFVVLDYINTQTIDSAHIFIPTQTVYESGGNFINNQGQMQQAKKAFSGGLPIEQTSMGDHPPREFRHDIPGTDFIRACDALSQLAQISLDDDLLSQTHFSFSNIEKNETKRFNHKWENKNINDKNFMELIIVDQTFGTEILSSCSPCLQELETDPYLFMHKNDAAKLDINQGETIKIELDDNINFKISIKILDNMAEGVMILPKYRKLAYQLFGKNRKKILKSKICKLV
ncbi:molybdopterin-dependent oxidoreductase, partial [Desulfobacterales bacterium HSG17]|nr:molybdopterin-dependent oxidoreductase [Desulfobacterales bacterium HSG17]